MAKLSKFSKEVLKELEGTEIKSLHYEDVVGIEKGKVISYGKIIDKLNTNRKVKRMLDEAFYDEFGYSPNSLQHKRALEEEFGKPKTKKNKQGWTLP